MKKILCSIFLIFYSGVFFSQTYSNYNISLISLIDPDTSTTPSPANNRYSGCWGWYQQSKNKEYAISGARDGTYFIDITNPATPSVCAFVLGKFGCTWREMKTYKNICYIISSDAKPNRFQIIDMSNLPNSVQVLYDGNLFFERGHAMWIDKDKMYVSLTECL